MKRKKDTRAIPPTACCEASLSVSAAGHFRTLSCRGLTSLGLPFEKARKRTPRDVFNSKNKSRRPGAFALMGAFTPLFTVLTGFLPSSAAVSIHSFKPSYDIGSDPSLSGHAIAYRWRSPPRVRRHRASKPQGSWFQTGDALADHYEPINMRLSFPHPLFV